MEDPVFFTFLRQNNSLTFRGPWLPKQRRVVKQERRLSILNIFYWCHPSYICFGYFLYIFYIGAIRPSLYFFGLFSLYLLLVPSIFYINILIIFFTSFIGAIHLIFVFLVICDRAKRDWSGKSDKIDQTYGSYELNIR